MIHILSLNESHNFLFWFFFSSSSSLHELLFSKGKKIVKTFSLVHFRESFLIVLFFYQNISFYLELLLLFRQLFSKVEKALWMRYSWAAFCFTFCWNEYFSEIVRRKYERQQQKNNSQKKDNLQNKSVYKMGNYDHLLLLLLHFGLRKIFSISLIQNEKEKKKTMESQRKIMRMATGM